MTVTTSDLAASDKATNQRSQQDSGSSDPPVELEQSSVQYTKSSEGHSNTAETAAKSPLSADVTSCEQIANSSDQTNTIAPEESCVPLCDMPSTVVSESDVDFFRLGVVPENLVASLFDDDNAVVQQQPTTEQRKGFVSSDHPDAANWFYQDPQGVVQGMSDFSELY